MITTQNLTDLGFKDILDVFTGKRVWVLGEEDTEICGNPYRLPILYYNTETQTCMVVRGEFCVVQRECKLEEEIIKFVESINFLFHISVVINSKKPIEQVLPENTKPTTEELQYFNNKLKETMGKDMPKKYLDSTDLGDIDKEMEKRYVERMERTIKSLKQK